MKGQKLLLVIGVVISSLPFVSAQDAEVEDPPSAWETTAALGFTLTQGNSDTVLATLNVLGLKKWELNELSAGFNGSYGEAEGVQNNGLARGGIQYNRLIGDGTSYYYGKVDLLNDAIADVNYRLSVSPGYGYYFRNDDKMTLSAEVGPGYILERVSSINDDYLTLRVGEKFEYKISDRARVWQSLEYLPQVDDFENFLIVAEVGVESDLTEKMSLRVSLQDNYDNQPAAGRKSNDLRLVTGIGYKF